MATVGSCPSRRVGAGRNPEMISLSSPASSSSRRLLVMLPAVSWLVLTSALCHQLRAAEWLSCLAPTCAKFGGSEKKQTKKETAKRLKQRLVFQLLYELMYAAMRPLPSGRANVLAVSIPPRGQPLRPSSG